MRLLGLGVVCLSGCGLLLDLDPPDVDGGPRVDSGDFDAVFVDGAQPDDARDPDVGFDSRPPLDGGSCAITAECELREPGCENECIDGICVRDDIDNDRICDLLDCPEGEIEYLATTCGGSRALQVCVNSAWREHEFDEVETCGPSDQDCDGAADESLGIESCGIGLCAGPRPCGESCVGGSPDMEVCSQPGELAEDEDCDGHVDEDCNDGISCTVISPRDSGDVPYVITGDGDYCLDVGECDAQTVPFHIRSEGVLANVRIHGDMHATGMGLYAPCPGLIAVPLSSVAVTSSLRVGGIVQVTNARFQGDGTETPWIVQRSEAGDPPHELRGHHIQIDGGNTAALVVGEGATALLSDVQISSTAEHTIESQGRLVVEASCAGRANGSARCNSVDASAIGGITKLSSDGANRGGSVIHLSGGAASLELTAVRVFGQQSTAIWAEGVASVGVFDSVIVSNKPEPVDGRPTRAAISLNGCTAGSIIRDSLVFNQGNVAGEAINSGVNVLDCDTSFTAPNRPSPVGGFHIVGSTGNNINAAGVRCGDGCRFEDISVAGFGPTSSPPVVGTGVGVECLGDCTVVRSTIVGNGRSGSDGTDVSSAVATGLRIGGGTVFRSRVRGGNAMVATGLVHSGGTLVHFQDSLAIGFAGNNGPALGEFSGRGVRLENGSRFSALHSTIAARSWARNISPAALCNALDADGATSVSLVSSLLWAPCEVAFSYYGADTARIDVADHVGVVENGVSYLGGEIMNVDLPVNFIGMSDATVFTAEYSGLTSPTGSQEMSTEVDLNGAMRSSPPPIGAYAN